MSNKTLSSRATGKNPFTGKEFFILQKKGNVLHIKNSYPTRALAVKAKMPGELIVRNLKGWKVRQQQRVVRQERTHARLKTVINEHLSKVNDMSLNQGLRNKSKALALKLSKELENKIVLSDFSNI